MKDSTKIYLYTCGWIFYYLQSLVGLDGSLVTAMWVLFMVGVSFLYVVAVHWPTGRPERTRLPLFILSLDLFLFVLTIYGVVYLFDDTPGEGRHFNYLKSIYASMFPIYFYYYYAVKGSLDDDLMRRLTVLFFCFVLADYFAGLKYGLMMNDGAKEVTNNAGYVCVALLPLLVLFEKRNLLVVALALLLYLLTILSMKRGAILVGSVLLLILFGWKLKNMEAEGRKRFLFLVCLFAVAVAGFAWLMWNHSDYFRARVLMTMAGETSGRDVLYSSLLSAFLDTSSNWQFLFGRGALATIEVTNTNVAHNDWLELATNQGCLGVLVYAFFFFSIAKVLLEKEKWDRHKQILLMIFVIFLLKSFFSMAYSSMDVVRFASLGFTMGSLQKKIINV